MALARSLGGRGEESNLLRACICGGRLREQRQFYEWTVERLPCDHSTNFHRRDLKTVITLGIEPHWTSTNGGRQQVRVVVNSTATPQVKPILIDGSLLRSLCDVSRRFLFPPLQRGIHFIREKDGALARGSFLK
jgi:hypothetical protein